MDASRWRRVSALVVALGAALWLAAGLVIVAQPHGPATVRAYSTLVPGALAMLLMGVGGLGAWLAGDAGRPRRRRWSAALTAAVLAMSSRRHAAIDAVGAVHDDPANLSARRIGVGAMRVGGLAVVVASLLLQGEVGTLRSLLHLGWLLFFAGVLVLGVAVLTAGVISRWAGALLMVGSLLVVSPIGAMLSGSTRRPDLLGPLLPGAADVPLLGFAAWVCFGAAFAWLAAGQWLAARPAPPALPTPDGSAL